MSNFNKKVMQDSFSIAQRLRDTDVTVSQLMIEYRAGYKTIKRAIDKHIEPQEWNVLRRRLQGKGAVNTRFKKGCCSWNKGVKGTHFSPATEFKEGHIPATSKTLFQVTIRKTKTGKKVRMIAMPGETPYCHKWIPYARYIYEREIGPVPAGCFVVHKDGKGLNDTPNNLIAVTRKENIELMRQLNPDQRAKAAKSMKKVWAPKRKTIARKKKIDVSQAREERKAIARKKVEGRQAAEEIKTRQAREEIETGQANAKYTKWECQACGYDLPANTVPDQCPKCNRGWFEEITVQTRMAI